MRQTLSIGELAAVAGVSTRTVRFYHAKGLLPEPERDASDYRRYTAADVIALRRVVALASAGVPLAEVGRMVDAPAEEFAEGLRRVDAGLRAEIARLRRLRVTVAELGSADRLALPPVLADAIEHLRASGAPTKWVDHCRDAWILTYAIYPDALGGWLEEYGVYTDPEYLQLTIRMLELADAEIDDPRIEPLAAESVDWMERTWDAQQSAWAVQMDDARFNEILTEQWGSSPVWEKIGRLVTEGLEERGLTVPDPGSIASS
ncbi:MAG: MerR family transcriptional regulator [Aeromicrobium sp.]|uniref:MerR family transcriptional regulator n=1 Tax=Aeromicrobium sp. TaxID=1871063 RepID=UPI0039E34082